TEAEVQLAAATAAEAANPSVVAISRRPAERPKNFNRAVEAAVAAAIRTPVPEPEPEVAPEPQKKPAVKAAAKKATAPDIKPDEQSEIDEPELASNAAPKIPTKASVAKQATYKNAINLSKTNLIGVYGTKSNRYALIRTSNGKYKKVKVGDKIDGGQIKAITDSEVRYQKGGRLIALKMPKT
ncbi:MAG: pilus assembly protein PilP, partial [Paracoccaceae bacterium]